MTWTLCDTCKHIAQMHKATGECEEKDCKCTQYVGRRIGTEPERKHHIVLGDTAYRIVVFSVASVYGLLAGGSKGEFDAALFSIGVKAMMDTDPVGFLGAMREIQSQIQPARLDK